MEIKKDYMTLSAFASLMAADVDFTEANIDYISAREYENCNLHIVDEPEIDFKVDFGGSEGIYLDIYLTNPGECIKEFIGATAHKKTIHILTVKTLDETWEAMEKMAVCGVRLMRAASHTFSDNRADILRKGYCLFWRSDGSERRLFNDNLDKLKNAAEKLSLVGAEIYDLEKRTSVSFS